MTTTAYYLPALIGDEADYVVTLTSHRNDQVWLVPGTERPAVVATAPTAPVHTAKISFDGCFYYISFTTRGTRSRKNYRTEAGARRAADKLGEVVDPLPAKYVLPIYLDPTSETYRCA